MRNTFVATVPACYGVKLARDTALRRCVVESSLRRDFAKGRIPDEDLEHFSKRMSDFIRERGLIIVSEKPIVRIDEDRDRYTADVVFTVAWT